MRVADDGRETRAAQPDDDVRAEEGIGWEDPDKEKARQAALQAQALKYGAVPVSELKAIPKAAERMRRHIPTVYDPGHDTGACMAACSSRSWL
jgi:hypothetical protein